MQMSGESLFHNQNSSQPLYEPEWLWVGLADMRDMDQAYVSKYGVEWCKYCYFGI